jgi:AcrR family transcriptional regulator
MVSQRRKSVEGAEPPRAANAIPEERILDAAYALLIAVGMGRLNMADLARQADISRATLYRRWPNVQAVLSALLTREFAEVTARAGGASMGGGRAGVVRTVVSIVGELRVHPLLRKIIEVDPDFLIPYLLQRRGSSSDTQLALIETGVLAGQADGSVRAGDAQMLACAVLLSAWSFTLTGPVFVPKRRYPALDAELSELIDRYLAP